MSTSPTYPPDLTAKMQQYGAALLPFSEIAALLRISGAVAEQYEKDFYTKGAALHDAYWRGSAEYLLNLNSAQMNAIFAAFTAPAEGAAQQQPAKGHYIDMQAVKQQEATRKANEAKYMRERRAWELAQWENEQ